MVFHQLLNKLDALKKADLLGYKTHNHLAPPNRLHLKDLSISQNARQASVLIFLYPNIDDNTCVLLTKRASYKGTHSKEISFPGGKQEINDIDLKATATREASEEVGIVAKNVIICKELSPVYVPPSNFLIHPFVGFATETPQFKKNYEVDTLIELSIEELLYQLPIITLKIKTSDNTTLKTPGFMYNNHKIWGATAMILNEFKELLKNL